MHRYFPGACAATGFHKLGPVMRYEDLYDERDYIFIDIEFQLSDKAYHIDAYRYTKILLCP